VAQLLLRAGAADEALMRRLLLSAPRVPALPDRLVVDAHVAPRSTIGATARAAGLPFLVDTQTHLLQDRQHEADPWAALPFACAEAWCVEDFDDDRIDRLIAESVDFQLAHGASQVLLPGVHVETADDGWVDVQLRIYARSRSYVARVGLAVPVLAPVELSWRLLGRQTWPLVLQPLVRGLLALGPDEIVLAADKVDRGAHPADRLSELVAVIEHLRHVRPVIAWQQGVLGEACLSAGALAYECGIGWREHCDLRGSARSRRSASRGGPRGRRPFYVHALRQSIPARAAAAIHADHPLLRAALTCPHPDCCPGGVDTLIRDARHHAVIDRARSVRVLNDVQRLRWRWGWLGDDVDTGLELAARINRTADRDARISRVSIAALQAMREQALVQRHSRQRRVA
jgi:hypothetical protein